MNDAQTRKPTWKILFDYLLTISATTLLTGWIPISFLNYLLPYGKYSDGVVASVTLLTASLWALVLLTIMKKIGLVYYIFGE
jgi:hypothetical protein